MASLTCFLFWYLNISNHTWTLNAGYWNSLSRIRISCFCMVSISQETGHHQPGYWLCESRINAGPALELIEAKYRIYASVNFVIIGLDNNGLLPGQHQAITWTNSDLSSFEMHKNKLDLNLNQNRELFIEEYAFENDICKWQPLCVSLNVLRYRHQ